MTTRDVEPYKIYQRVHILMLLWQHARFQSLPLQNQILPFVAVQGLIQYLPAYKNLYLRTC